MTLARWQATITDLAGNVKKGASVEVRHERGGAPLANIYADRDGNTTLGNPFLANDEGFAAFHALGGAYRVTATKGSFSKTWRYVPIGNAQEQDGIASGVRLRFNDETDNSDPGSGFLKFNNSDLGSVTEIYISDVNSLEFDISVLVDTFDDGGIVSNRGLLTIQSANNDGFFVGQVTGDVVSDGSPSSYRTLTVTPLAFSDTPFIQDDIVGIVFNQAGGGLAAPVSLADIQEISTQRFLGRSTAGTGVIEQLTVAQALALLATGDPFIATSGSIIRSAEPVVNGLVITNNATTPTTSIDIDAKGAVLVNASGNGIRTGPVDLTINATGTGANGLDTGSLANNTWYYIWLISNGTTTAGLLSLSATAPTMPGGYTISYRVGAIRTGGSATFVRIRQVGNRAQYQVVTSSTTPNIPIMASGTAGNTATPTWVAIATGDFVPPTAVQICGRSHSPSSSGTIIVAPNNDYGDRDSVSNSPPVASNLERVAIPFQFVLETANIYWASGHSSGTIGCTGWVDAVNAS